MSVRLVALLLSVTPLLASAADCPQALKEARARWAATGIVSYRYTLWRDSGAWTSYSSPVRVTVTDGRVTAAHSLRYYSLPGPELRFHITERELEDISRFVTIPGLLDQIAGSLQRPDVVTFSCTFHPELGAPLSYSYEIEGVYDSGSGFSVSDLEIQR